MYFFKSLEIVKYCSSTGRLNRGLRYLDAGMDLATQRVRELQFAGQNVSFSKQLPSFIIYDLKNVETKDLN